MSEAHPSGAGDMRETPGPDGKYSHHPVLDRLQVPALVAGAAGLVVFLVLVLIPRTREMAFQSYLYAFLFWLGIPLGSLALLMIQHLSGGTWGLVIRRLLECGVRMLVLMAVLFLPVWLFGIGPLYVWDDLNDAHDSHGGGGGGHAAAPAEDGARLAAAAEPGAGGEKKEGAPGHGVGAADHPNAAEHAGAPERSAAGGASQAGGDTHSKQVGAVRPFKSWWLTPGFYRVRAVFYFAVWIGLGLLLNSWSDAEDRDGHPRYVGWFQAVSGPGLLLYVLTMTFAAFDWAMSIDPHWYSTIFGILFIVGQGLSTMAFIIAMVSLLGDRRPLAAVVSPGLLNDLGNLLLAFTMLWAYMSFSQFLIMWSGNIAEEVPWYYYRTRGGWQYVAVLLIVLHFALPFLLLLSRRVKRAGRLLACIALGIIVMRWVDLFWVLAPNFQHDRTTPHPTHGPIPGIPFGALLAGLAAILGIGGVWVFVFIWQLKRRPLLPRHDYRLADLAAAGAHH